MHFPNCSTSVNGSTESTKIVYINSSPVLQIVYALGATCAALVICIVLALCGMCVRKGKLLAQVFLCTQSCTSVCMISLAKRGWFVFFLISIFA